MNKVFIYKMDAGHCGTEEAFTIVSEEPLLPEMEEEYLYDHATQYQEPDEDGEWPEGDPNIWLESTVTSLKELEEESGCILYGNDTFEELVIRLEKEGMVFNGK